MVGLNDDANRVLPSAFQEEGNQILLIGKCKGEFGGSLYIKALYDQTVGVLPNFDYKKELALWELVIEANKKGLLKAAKDVNVGGVAIALSKMAAVSSKGVIAHVPVENSRDIFDESQSRALLEVENRHVVEVTALAKELDLDVAVIGMVAGDEVKINEVSLPLERVKDIYFNTFAKTIEQDL
jgi:phosphoribosylformylglycinamidine synthase